MLCCFLVTLSLTVANARSFQLLTLALQKCSKNLDPLPSETRLADKARVHMRVIECKHFLDAWAAIVFPELCTLHTRSGALATLVGHVLCILPDHDRIHFLLT